MVVPQKSLTLKVQIRKKKKLVKKDLRKIFSSLNILIFFARKIDTVGIVKNKPIATGKTIKPRGNNKKCFLYIKKGFTIQCIEPEKKPIPKTQPVKKLSFKDLTKKISLIKKKIS